MSLCAGACACSHVPLYARGNGVAMCRLQRACLQHPACKPACMQCITLCTAILRRGLASVCPYLCISHVCPLPQVGALH